MASVRSPTTAHGRSPVVNDSGRTVHTFRRSFGLACRHAVSVVTIEFRTSSRNVVFRVHVTVPSVTVHGAPDGQVGSTPPDVPDDVARHRGRPVDWVTIAPA